MKQPEPPPDAAKRMAARRRRDRGKIAQLRARLEAFSKWAQQVNLDTGVEMPAEFRDWFDDEGMAR